MRNLLELAIAVIAMVLAILLFVRWTRKKQAAAADEILQKSENPALRERLQQRIRHEAETYRQEEAPEETAADLPLGPISESISVVLRRQVPLGEEAARSWFGGLPMLPDDVEWPRGVNPEHPDKGAVPLHFVAQICCADLPAELWGGLGPREGWLLLFVNGNTCFNDDPETWRLLHTTEPGQLRQPPADIGVIQDGVYTGGSAWTQSKSSYPHWPLDLVSVANNLRHENGRSWPTPDDFEKILYPGKRVQHDRHKLPRVAPYSRRVLQQGLKEVIATLSKAQAFRPVGETVVTELGRSANMDLVRAEAARQSDGRLAALLSECRDAQALADRATADNDAMNEWRREVVTWLEEWQAAIKPGTLDDPLSQADRQRIELVEGAPPQGRWVIGSEGGIGDMPRYTGLRWSEQSLNKLLTEAWSKAGQELMLEHYLDPARRYLLPDVQLPGFEAYWRSLRQNRPHRMGGYHDGVQSDAVEGPQENLLLLQLASDDAAEFCWGDAGAVYVFVPAADLAENRFDSATFHLECH